MRNNKIAIFLPIFQISLLAKLFTIGKGEINKIISIKNQSIKSENWINYCVRGYRIMKSWLIEKRRK